MMIISPENAAHRARQHYRSRAVRSVPIGMKLEPAWSGKVRRAALREDPPRVQKLKLVESKQ